jgi:hypothetical protein
MSQENCFGKDIISKIYVTNICTNCNQPIDSLEELIKNEEKELIDKAINPAPLDQKPKGIRFTVEPTDLMCVECKVKYNMKK